MLYTQRQKPYQISPSFFALFQKDGCFSWRISASLASLFCKTHPKDHAPVLRRNGGVRALFTHSYSDSPSIQVVSRLTVVVELALDLWVVFELQVVLANRNRPHLPRVAGAALCRRLRVRLYHLQIRAIYLIINIFLNQLIIYIYNSLFRIC